MACVTSGQGRQAIPPCEYLFEYQKKQLGIGNLISLAALNNLVKAYLLADRP